MQITTPSGYEVTLKDKLTFGEVRLLQKKLFSGVKVKLDQGNREIPEMDMSNLLDYSDKAMPILVTKIVKGDATITTGFDTEVGGWDFADGQAVLDAVDKILKPIMGNGEEKKTV